MAKRETEKHFQQCVIDLAELHGWKVWHQRPARVSVRGGETYRSAGIGHKGAPDLLLARNGKVLNAELKTETGEASADQLAWLAACGPSGRLWRPSDWDEILDELSAPVGPPWDAPAELEESDDELPDGRPCGRSGCNNLIADPSWNYAWCPTCAEFGTCGHGERPEDCDTCAQESDRAFDEGRERQT